MEISEINPDGNVYQLKDATARTEIAQIKAQDVYSTAETDTGKKWIDGRTIYRKAGYHAGTVSTANVTLDNSLTKSVVDFIVTESGGAVAQAGALVPFGAYAESDRRAYAQITENGLMAMASSVSYSKIYWIIEYVKKN